MKNIWKWIIVFVLVFALTVWWFWNGLNKDQRNIESGIPEGWKEGIMEISSIKFHYPSDWYFQQGYIPHGKFGKSEYMQIYSTHDFNARDKNKGYLCLDFRSYPATGQPSWNCKNELGSGEKKILTTKFGNIELKYNGENSLAKGMISSCILKNDREIGVTISFNCVMSDDEYLHDSNSSFRDRPEILAAEKILETIEFLNQ